MATATKSKKIIDRTIFRTPLLEVKFADAQGPLENNVSTKVQLIRTGTFYHAQYGKMEITSTTLKSFVKNFNERIRKIDIAIDYKHDSDSIAAGWIKELYFDENENVLIAQVQWTTNGKRVLMEKEFRYLSAEFNLNYQDTETLKEFGPTLLGAGLTNRPFIKGMEPVVPLSEGKKAMSVMSPEDMTSAIQGMQAAIEKMNAGGNKEAAAPGTGDEGPGKNAKKADPQGKEGDDEPDQDDSAGNAGDSKEGDDQADEMSYEEMKKQFAAAQKELADLKKKAAPAKPAAKAPAAPAPDAEDDDKEDKAASEKKGEFDRLLSEGKVIAGQREAFMKNDMIKFAALAKTVKVKRLSESTNEGDDNMESAEDRIMKLAEELVTNKKAKELGAAISMVLSDPKNGDLKKRYERDSYNQGFNAVEAE